jgi:hypothetical protein
MKFAIFRRHRPLAFNGTFREGKTAISGHFDDFQKSGQNTINGQQSKPMPNR